MLQVHRASNTELLMLVLDFKVDYRLKNTQMYSVECLEDLNEDMYIEERGRE